MCVDRALLCDEKLQMVFVKSGLTSTEFHSRLDDYNGTPKVLKAWRTEGLVLCEQKACDS